jgi:serine/threonine protein phosphatase PrpC
LTEGLFNDQLRELLREPEPELAAAVPAFRLVEEALKRSGRDNTTALVVEVVS